jgi:transcriptional regulator with XRE-family HTH domain
VDVTFGKKIKELRIRARLSQRDLAERVAKRLKDEDRRGFDFTYLSKIENDRLEHYPSASAILALAAVLNEELSTLSGEDLADSDELLALAGKPPPDVGELLRKSHGARMFFRSALSTNLSEKDWKEFLLQIKRKKDE